MSDSRTAVSQEIQASQTHYDPAALEIFWNKVGGLEPRILDAGCGAGLDLRWFHARGGRVTGIDLRQDLVDVAKRSGASAEAKDLRLWSAPADTYDAIWCNRVAQELKPEELQRVLLTFFKCLKSHGWLFVSYPLDVWTSPAMGALLLQCGFETIQMADRQVGGQAWQARMTRRVGGLA
jgi:2-polyprenyl-3-methyl-5-hydroxy-6-metoxy-1,4-benzoquinol methylase